MNISPHIIRSGVLNHLVDSAVDSSRDTIKADLVEKIVYDDPQVFKRLRIDEVDDNLVKACTRLFEVANKEDVELLVEVAEKASNKDNAELDREEKADKADDSNKEEKSGNHGSAEEKRMYDPLVRLFNYIGGFDKATPPYRKFQKTNGMLKPNESHTFGFPSCSPDLTIASGENASKSKMWRDRDAFGEVKPSIKQGPKPTIAGTIPDIVTQSADYARLFMSARPFLLFCVGIMIFGTKFCVGIFDRDGITFSPIYDMFEDTETLIRLVRSLLCNLCMEKLGSDPTVRTLDPSETQRLAGQRSRGFPSAVVSSVGNDHRLWCTIGPPIWTSMSFLGRGTNTWLIREYEEGTSVKSSSLHGNDMIMKTAWRSSARKPESDIYNLIPHPPEGLAKFECGGDVKFALCHITVQNLRSDMVNTSLPEDNHEPTPILHRLVLRTVGRPMWEYTSDLDLLLGFRDALRAHEDLCNQGILHRDISAGNILLAMNQDGPLRGFITDLEFARIDITKPQVITITAVGPQDKFNDRGRVTSKTEPTTRTHITFESQVEVERGAPMTGTAQFMAWELLEQEPAGSVEHQVKHDVESFIWVLSYCVMRNIFERASKSSVQKVRSQCSNFRRIIRQAFGLTTKVDIAAARQSRSAILVFPKRLLINQIVSNFMTPGLINLFQSFEIIVHHANDPQSPTAITHGALLKVVDKAITLLS